MLVNYLNQPVFTNDSTHVTTYTTVFIYNKTWVTKYLVSLTNIELFMPLKK